ncbi:MAG: DUF2335 domain-containing protein [Selenomonadaceae bacterium]|nr:DUF2335 domain-containing protein [Selenomonadaceae bacterium]MBP3722981.1 DUF2335 domain-containing protein [Selenomonadaceae bacterium]
MKRNKPQTVNEIDQASAKIYSQASLSYSGPLPLPQILQGYKEIDSSFPERVFSDFEKNEQHIRDQERKSLEISARNTTMGQIMAFIIIMTGLISTVALAYFDKDAAAVGLALGTIAMIFKGAFKK